MKKNEARSQVLTGRAGVGKTYHCLNLFREKILRSPQSGLNQPSFFILPSNEHKDRILSLLLRDKRFPGVLNFHVLTIHDFIRLRSRKSDRRTLSHFERAWTLRRILETPGWSWLERSRKAGGTASLLADFVREAKASLVSAADLERMSASGGAADPLAGAKFADLTRLLREYDAACIDAGVVDPEDELAAASHALLEGGQTPHAELVIFDGFFSFTEAQLLFVRAVSRAARKTVVTLTLDEARPSVFRYPLETRRRLLEAGFSEERIEDVPHRFRHPGLAVVERSLFSSGEAGAGASEAQAAVTLLEASGERQEAEMIAREVLKRQREAGHFFSDFMVVVRDMSPYRRFFEEVFSEFGIPFEIHERKRLFEHPLPRFLHAWIAAFAAGDTADAFDEAAFLALLREPFLKLDPACADEIERAIRRAVPAEGGEKLRALAQGTALSAPAKQQVAHMLDAAAVLRTADVAGLRAYFLSRTDELAAAEPGDEAVAACASEIREVLEAVSVDRGGSDRTEFLTRFASALKMGLYPVEHADLNRVQVYDVSLALQKEYRVVFVAGLSRGRFPRPASQDPVLKDDERKRFNALRPAFDTSEQREDGERYYFYMAATRAREALFLSRVRADADGREVAPSYFLGEFLRILGPEAPAAVRRAPAVLPELSEVLTLREARRVFCAYPEKNIKRKFAADVVRLAGVSADAGLEETAHRIEIPNRIQDPAAVAEFTAEGRPFSASRLMLLENCTYRYFASRILRLDDEGEPGEAPQDGNVLHRVLEEAYKEWAAHRRGAPDADALERTVLQRLDVVFDAFPVPGERPYRSALRKSRLAAMLRNYCVWEKARAARFPGFEPKFFEWTFGSSPEGREPDAGPLKIETPMGPLELCGRIDRIDVSADGRRALIIDYKRNHTLKPQSLAAGEEPQVGIYLLAVKRLLGIEPAGMEFISLSREKPVGVYRAEAAPRVSGAGVLSEAEFEAMIEASCVTLGAALGKLRSADIRIVEDEVDCKYCEYHGLCRFEDWREKRQPRR